MSDVVSKTNLAEVHLCDAFELLKGIPSESVDLVFTDPPYWTLNKWRDVGTTTRLGGHRDKDQQTGWFATIDETELWELMCELHRVLKRDRHACMMCDGQTLKWVLGYAEEAGYSYAKPIVWDKVHQGMGYHLRCRHEFVVLLDKGKNRKPNDLSQPDIVTIPMVKGGYPTEKPVGLPAFFIEQFTSPDELVCDPFMGSGSTGVAATGLTRRFIGGDSSPKAFETTKARLQEEKLL